MRTRLAPLVSLALLAGAVTGCDTDPVRPAAAVATSPALAIAVADAPPPTQIHADSISANIRQTHTPYGTVIDPIYADSTPGAAGYMTLTGYSRAADAAIWTGHYLAAEAIRSRVTGSTEALDNVRGAVGAITALLDVTGTNVLARFSVPASDPYAAPITTGEAQHGIYVGTVNGETRCWLGNTSRDQYSGVFFGLGVAYDMVSDATIQAEIRRDVTRMLDNLIRNGWNVVMPAQPTSSPCPPGTSYSRVSTTFLQRPEMQLAFLQIGRHVNPTRYTLPYLLWRSMLAQTVSLPIQTECQDTHNSYYKFNLDYINLYNLVRLEEAASPYRALYLNAYATLRGCTRTHGNAHFNMVDRGLTGAEPVRDHETSDLLSLWLTRRRRDYPTDVSDHYPACGVNQSCIPVAVDERVNTDFLWQRSPFQMAGGKFGTIETAAIDYNLPYWMARYYGTLTS